MLTYYSITKIKDEAEYENDPSERKIPLSVNLQQTRDGTINDSDHEYQGKNASGEKNLTPPQDRLKSASFSPKVITCSNQSATLQPRSLLRPERITGNTKPLRCRISRII
jgi:hypothetical protein